MQHFEKLFLLEEAWYLWDQTLDAEKDGDEFFPSETFVELSNNTHAKARIVRPKTGQAPVLVLIIRGGELDKAEAAARGFFEKGYETKFKDASTGDFVFISSSISSRLRPSASQSGGSTC